MLSRRILRAAMLPAALMVGSPLAAADQLDVSARQAIEQAHQKWLSGINEGDSNAARSVLSPNVIGVDAFGKTRGAQYEQLMMTMHAKGIVLTTQIDDVEPLSGGNSALLSGTFVAKYADPGIPPGRGAFVQVYEMDGSGWKLRANTASRTTLSPIPGQPMQPAPK